MASDRPWEDRVAYVIRRAGHRLRRERSVFVRGAIDFDLGIVSESGFFGPLVPELIGRRVLVEHYSGPPEPDNVERALLKALAVQIRPSTMRKAARASEPVLQSINVSLVVLCGAGIGGFGKVSLGPDTQEIGWYSVEFPRLRVHVIDAARLNPDGRWGMLRFAMALPEDPTARIAELLGDPRASIVAKREVLEATVNKRIESTPNERRVTYESIHDRGWVKGVREGVVEGRREGVVEGRREGVVEGRRESALAFAEALGLNVGELARIDSIDTLEARVLAAARAAR